MIRRYWTDLLYVALATGIVLWVAWDAFQFRLITYSPGSDYWEHTAVLRALLDNPWHPSHPLIAGDIPSPRFGPHFLLVALAGRALHYDAVDTMALGAVFNTVLVLAGIWLFFRSYFREPRASLYGLVVFFGSWLEAPHFSNVFKLKVFFSVAGYPSSAALAVTLLGLTLVVRLLRAERRSYTGLALSALTWAYVYITHPLTATMALPAAVLLALTEPGVLRERRLWVAGSVAFGFCLSALWPYYPALGMVFGGTVHRMRRLDPDAFAPEHEFYDDTHLYNILGYCLLSFLILPYLWVRRQDVFVVLGALLMLLVFTLGAFFPIPLGHRYVLLAVFFLQIALVRLLVTLTPRAPKPGTWLGRLGPRIGAGVLVAAFLVWLTLSNIAAAREHFRRTAAGAHDKESVPLRYARRVGELAGPRAIVLSTALASWSLPTFGPKIVTPLHKNPLIFDAEERRHDALSFFSPRATNDERRDIVARYHVTHVVVPARNLSAVSGFLRDAEFVARLPGGYTLYSLTP
ncbi:MAG TPA: hypothetical protein VLJ38_19310 [Polyangiaceae bacterium]|nr:hypothetical protein [Polyangiaceae bacterium]